MKKKLLLLSIGIILFSLFSTYFNNKEIYISDITKNDIINDNKLSFYIQESEGSEKYTNSKIIPSKEDGYVFSKYVCSDDSEITFNSSKWSIIFSRLKTGITKCSLYFNIDMAKARTYILAQNTINETEPTFSNVATTNEGMFKAEDDAGDSYYYRGAVTNNWFYFGGYYWRIIRINGDGTIRLIYNGTSTATTGTGTQITTGAFNSGYNNNAYLGYMYETGVLHGIKTSSAIKDTLETWYESNLKNDYATYIDTNAGFCNDRNNSTSSTGAPDNSGGTGTIASYYATRYRMYVINKPSFKCTESLDLFTTSDANQGNKALTYPIGTINSDEVAYAGGVFNNDNSNTAYYLYTGQNYWIMSPSHFASSIAYSYNISSGGYVTRTQTNSSLGIRPVVNIRKDVELTGTGTSSDPYKIVGEPEKVSTRDTILANMTTITTRSSFSAAYTTATTGTIFTAEDDDGTSYYFAGAPTDNWVKFGGFYWRIVRINGDGTIRLIYNGTSTATTGTGTQIGTSAFNSTYAKYTSVQYEDNVFVGYMYEYGVEHGLTDSSTIKNTLDSWYNSKLANYASYIDTNAGFCGDRGVYEKSYNSSYREYEVVFNAYNRLNIIKTPSLKCTYSSDLYTISSSSKGNKALSNPIGLITADEATFAGGGYLISNSSLYLYTGELFWTMTPWQFNFNGGNYSRVLLSNGALTPLRVDYSYGVRPVINLRADVKLSGSGTSSDPYLVS